MPDLSGSIAAAQGKMNAALAKALKDLKTRITLGVGSRAEWDASGLNVLVGMMESALRESGFNAVADEFGTFALEAARKIDKGIEIVHFGGKEANALSAAANARYEGWRSVAYQPIDYIRNRLIQNTITATPAMELAKDLVAHFEDLQPYAETYIETALHQQARDTWAVAGENMGAEVYRYSGPPLIPSSHEFCQEHYEEERPLSEWQDMDNGTDLPVVWSCGGWNCRHYLEPIPPGMEGKLK